MSFLGRKVVAAEKPLLIFQWLSGKFSFGKLICDLFQLRGGGVYFIYFSAFFVLHKIREKKYLQWFEMEDPNMGYACTFRQIGLSIYSAIRLVT